MTPAAIAARLTKPQREAILAYKWNDLPQELWFREVVDRRGWFWVLPTALGLAVAAHLKEQAHD